MPPSWAQKKTSSSGRGRRGKQPTSGPSWAGRGGATQETVDPGAFTLTSRPKQKKKGKSFWSHVAEPFVSAEHTIAGIPAGLAMQAEAVSQDLIGHVYNAAAELAGVPTHGHVAFNTVPNRVQTGQTMKKVIKPLLHSYAHKYGSGDLTTTLSRMFMEDPLGTVGDIATLASLGEAGAFRAGLLEARPTAITLRSGEGAITKDLAGTGLSRRAKATLDSQLKKHVPETTKIVGEQSRYARAEWLRLHRAMLRRTLKSIPYLMAENKLTPAERVASNLRHSFPDRDALQAERAKLDAARRAHNEELALADAENAAKAAEQGAQYVPHEPSNLGQDFEKLVDESSPRSKKIMEHYDNPTDRMKAYEAEARKLGLLAGANAGLEATTQLERRYAPMLEHMGAYYSHDPFRHFDPGFDSWLSDIRAATAKGKTQKVEKLAKQGKDRFDLTDERIKEIAQSTDRIRHPKRNFGAITKQVQVGHREGQILAMNPDTQTATVRFGWTDSPKGEVERARLEAQRAGLPLDDLESSMFVHEVPFSDLRDVKQSLHAPTEDGLPLPKEQNSAQLAKMIEQINARLKKNNRPEPIYRPEKMIVGKKGTDFNAGAVGRNPSPRSPTNQSLGRLRYSGNVNYTEDTLAAAYLRTVRYQVAQERHAALLRAGKLVPADEPLEPGWEFIRRSSGEEMGHQLMSKAEFTKAVDDFTAYQRGIKSPFTDLKNDLTTDSIGDAYLTEDGRHHVVVPTRVVDKIVGDFHHGTNTAAKAFRSATTAWRRLVLNLRLGWLVNNMVGNTALYAISNAGPGTFRAMRRHPDNLSAPDIEQWLSEQTQSIVGSARPSEGRLARSMENWNVNVGGKQVRVGRGIKAIPHGFQEWDKRYEQRLRRATADRALNKAMKDTPHLKDLAARMKVQGHTLGQIKAEMLKNPAVADRISSEVSRTLGDFSDLSNFEQTVIRGFVPFYAWYKAIFRVAMRMPLENPYRTAILAQLGNLGEQGVAKNSPVLGAFQLPGGWILKSQGFNPYMTIPQTAASAAVLAHPGNIKGDWGFSGIKAPSAHETAFAAGILNPLVSWPMTGGPSHTIRYLPETRILMPPHSKAYQDHSRLIELLNWAGIGVRKPR